MWSVPCDSWASICGLATGFKLGAILWAFCMVWVPSHPAAIVKFTPRIRPGRCLYGSYLRSTISSVQHHRRTRDRQRLRLKCFY